MANQEQITSHIISKTDEYLRVPSVVGHEKPFLDYLYNDYEKMGYTTIRDDNIVVVSGNKPESFILSAHVDRHGILSIGNGDYRYAAHAVKNYKYDEEAGSEALSHLENICSQFEAEEVYAYGRWSGHVIASGSVNNCHYCTKRSNLVFKIENMDEMPEGIPVAYTHDSVGQDGYIVGQLDNTLSVALIHGLYEAGFQGTVIFTAEEEIGKSWKHLGGFLNTRYIETNHLIVLDTSPYDTSEYADKGKVVLRNRDSFGTFNEAITQDLQNTCEALGLAYDVKDKTLIAQGKTEKQLGRTELGRLIHEFKGRWSGTTLQIPTFNYHTNNESTTRQAISNVLSLLVEYCVRRAS